MIQINLLPVRAERRKEFIRRQLIIAGLSLFVAIVVMGLFYHRLQTRFAETKKELQLTNRRIKALEPVIRKIEEYKKQKAEISKKIAIIIDLDRRRPAPVIIFSDLNRLHPDKLWFTSLKQNGKNLTITGVAIDNETVVSFLNNLKKSKVLKNADLTMLRSQKVAKLTLKGFTINCPLDLESLDQAVQSLSGSKENKVAEENNG